MAQAQATRTWVSGVGDDANPCSRTAPCKTFAGAISKTAATGEISVLDPGGFGAVTITKSITIDGNGTVAGILASGTNGVIVNTTSDKTVILRNISINGAGTGINGIRHIGGGNLIVENVSIVGFLGGAGTGIDIATTASSSVSLTNVSIANALTGIKATTSAGKVNVSANRVNIHSTTNAIQGLVNSNFQVNDSVISNNTGFGVVAQGGSVISLENSMLTGNGIAVEAQLNSKIRLSGNRLYENGTSYSCGAGQLSTGSDNLKAGDTSGNPVCPPNINITIN